MTAPDADRLKLVVDDGTEFDLWTNATISDDFLTPCQTMTLSVSADESRFDLVSKIQIGQQFIAYVNDNPVIGGFIDSVEMSDDWSGGVSLTVTGRDVLGPVVDSNVNPRLQVRKEMSLVELAQLVFVDEFDLPITIFDDLNDDGPKKCRDLSAGLPIAAKKGSKRGKKKARDPLKEMRPHPNEGGFQYFSRFAHRSGFHAWAMPDGSGVVIGTPTWDQEPAYQLRRLRATTPGRGSQNNIERGRAKLDLSQVPSDVWVRGKSTKAGDKSQPIGYAHFDAAPFFKPFYVVDDESSDPDHANAVARFTLGKALRHACSYEVTVRGMADPATGRVYTVDTVVDIRDERCGINGLMWVEQRTFRKSRQGTFTDLKLIPADSLLMDYYVSDSPPPPPPTYKAAQSARPKKKPTMYDWTGSQVYVEMWRSDNTTQERLK